MSQTSGPCRMDIDGDSVVQPKNESPETEPDMFEAQVAIKKIDAEASMAVANIEASAIDKAIKDQDPIATGGFGFVYKAKLDGHDKDFAIKVPKDVNLKKEKEAFKDEVQILGKIGHPHIVMLHGACIEKCTLVYEYLSNGTLAERLKQGQGNDKFPWQERILVAANISEALVHLHDTLPDPIAHGDLKPDNILFDAENTCKLADFGISRFLQEKTTGGVSRCHKTDEPKGSGSYKDPDFNEGHKKLTCQADQFAFGIILLELVTGQGPLRLRELVSEKMNTLGGKEEHMKIKRLSKLNLMDTTWTSNDKSKKVALKMLELGLQCSEEKRKDRPDFKNIVCEEVLALVARLRQ